jgi:hypothetical protein
MRRVRLGANAQISLTDPKQARSISEFPTLLLTEKKKFVENKNASTGNNNSKLVDTKALSS